MPETLLGDKLKKLRKEKTITQTKLSEKLGLSARYIAKVEIGLAKPSMEVFKKLADFFQVPIEYLVSENEEVTNLAAAPIRNKELLDAFIEADKLNIEDQKLILDLVTAIITNHKMKTLMQGTKQTGN
jgi:transcriptional regulator with XRE-family HTH domain